MSDTPRKDASAVDLTAWVLNYYGYQPTGMTQEQQWLYKLASELADKERENEALRKGLDAVVALINESHGVSGLHLNGDIAPWEELRTGGSFDDWLSDFDAAIKEQS